MNVDSIQDVVSEHTLGSYTDEGAFSGSNSSQRVYEWEDNSERPRRHTLEVRKGRKLGETTQLKRWHWHIDVAHV